MSIKFTSVLKEKALSKISPQIQFYVIGVNVLPNLQRMHNIFDPNLDLSDIGVKTSLTQINQFWKRKSGGDMSVHRISINFFPGDTPTERNYIKDQLEFFNSDLKDQIPCFIYLIPCPNCAKCDINITRNFLHNILPFIKNVIVVLDHDVELGCGPEKSDLRREITISVSLGLFSKLGDFKSKMTAGCNTIESTDPHYISQIVKELGLEDFQFLELDVSSGQKITNGKTFIPNVISKYGLNVEYLFNCLKHYLIKNNNS